MLDQMEMLNSIDGWYLLSIELEQDALTWSVFPKSDSFYRQRSPPFQSSVNPSFPSGPLETRSCPLSDRQLSIVGRFRPSLRLVRFHFAPLSSVVRPLRPPSARELLHDNPDWSFSPSRSDSQRVRSDPPHVLFG
jgi:hypothetical protein